MTELEIRLLGQFSVSLEATPITNFTSDKVRALLAYLVTDVRCPHRREIIANLLWSDQPEEASRANLRRALYDLRKCIQDHNASPPYLLISRQDIQFNSESNTWVDIELLDHLYRQNEISPANQYNFQQSIDLYQGEFLEGFNITDNLYFNEWVLLTREQQNRKMVSILKRVANYYESRREFEASLPFAWRLVEMEPWHEDARRQLMRLLAQTGKRCDAINQYEILVELLKEELDIEPEARTTDLYNSIKQGKDLLGQEPEKRVIPVEFQDAASMQSSVYEVFVSREKELGDLNQILEAALSGQGRLGFVSGEAGSGKSMLAQEFVRQAQTRYSTLVSAVGFCNPFSGMGDPFLPFRDILFQLCGNLDHSKSKGFLSQSFPLRLWNSKPDVIRALTLHGDELMHTFFSSKTLLNFSASLEKSHPHIYAEVNDLIARTSTQFGGAPPQPSIFTQYTEVLKEVSKSHPLLLVLDDLQWADTGTVGLLFHLGKQLAGSSIMLLGLYRSEEVSIRQDGAPHPLMSVLSELQRDHGEITISLDKQRDKAFVDDLLDSEPNNLSEDFHEALLKHTNGHPLFTVELLRDLQDNGILVRDGEGRWNIKQDFLIDKLPPKIEGIIGKRICRLPDILQRVLTCASVEGESFTAEVIAEVEGLSMSQVINLFSRQLNRQHRLVRAQQIEINEKKSTSIYKFRHILFQKYLYDELDEIEKTNYHARVGTALEALAGEDKAPHAVYLARHFHKASQVEKAVLYYQIAGQVAMGMSGHLEATAHFENALALLLSLPESPERNETELGLQLQTGLAYQAIQGYASEAVGKAFKRARELGRIVENPVMAKQSYQLIFSYYSNIAELEIAKETIELIYQYLDRNTAQGNMEYFWGTGYLDLCLGNIGSAFENFTKMLAFYDLEEARSTVQTVGMEAGVLGNGHAAVLAICAGYPDRAKKHIRNILEIAEVWRDSGVVQTDAMWYPAWTYYELGEYDTAEQYLEKAMALAEKHHIIWITSFLKVIQGRGLAQKGKYEEAIKNIHEGLDILKMVGFATFLPFVYQGLAEVYYAAGKAGKGLDIISKAETFAEDTGVHRFSSPIQRIKGDLLLTTDEGAAEEAYQNAISIAVQQGAKMMELKAAIRLGLLWRRQGKQAQSVALIQPIYDWFTEGFDNPWVVEARNLLDICLSNAPA